MTALPRNASPAVPRIARVVVQCDDHPGIRSGIYRSLLDADLMLARAFSKEAAPVARGALKISGTIVWTDGHRIDRDFHLDRQAVAESVPDGGVLRHAFLELARVMASGRAFHGFDPRIVAQHQAEGRALLERLEVDPSPLALRNVSSSAWPALTLLPDPAAAIARLRDRFLRRRKRLAAPLDPDPDAPPDMPSATYPETTHADVRHVVNHVTIALGNDLPTLPHTARGVIWNHWHAVTQTVETLLRVGRKTEIYADNEGLWLRQLPALVGLIEDAREGRLRNGRLNFRPVGTAGRYPDWVRELRDRSGVYVIRERMRDGSTPIVYVGSSDADRLYATLTRHFQSWRRRKGFWSGQYGAGHDPGVTWPRAACEVAVIITPPQHAREMEQRLIRRLQPRDNLVWKGNQFLTLAEARHHDEAEVPF